VADNPDTTQRIVTTDNWLPNTGGNVVSFVYGKCVEVLPFTATDEVSFSGTPVDCTPNCEDVELLINWKTVKVSITCLKPPEVTSWTGDDALEKFDYAGQNDRNVSHIEYFDNGRCNVTGAYSVGLQADPVYDDPKKETWLQDMNEKIFDEQGKIISAKFLLKIMYIITLKPDKISYPRKTDKICSDNTKAKKISTIIYLHEFGHQLDAWRIVPRGGIRAIAVLENTITGENGNEIDKKAKEWSASVSEPLRDKLLTNIRGKMEAAEKQYHCKYWSAGNPWENKQRGGHPE
jgi:hypothetical protein